MPWVSSAPQPWAGRSVVQPQGALTNTEPQPHGAGAAATTDSCHRSPSEKGERAGSASFISATCSQQVSSRWILRKQGAQSLTDLWTQRRGRKPGRGRAQADSRASWLGGEDEQGRGARTAQGAAEKARHLLACVSTLVLGQRMSIPRSTTGCGPSGSVSDSETSTCMSLWRMFSWLTQARSWPQSSK